MLKGFLEHLDDGILRSRPLYPFLDLTPVEQKQGGDSSDVVAARHRLVLVDVDLANLGALGILPSDGGDSRGHHPTGGAPFRPEVHQHRLVRFEHLLFEVHVREYLDIVTRHLSEPPAPSWFSLVYCVETAAAL